MEEQPLHYMEVSAQPIAHTDNLEAVTAIESGQVLYFPNYSFALTESENALLSETILDSGHKNISYNTHTQRLSGLMKHNSNDLFSITQNFMQSFANFSEELIHKVLPKYQPLIQIGRTSYRPAEIKGRKTSKRKDDTRLHVDSFSATPVNGLRILRVFCNINPYNDPRVWHVGEPLGDVIERFSERLPRFQKKRAKLLHWLKATKTLRSPYDHYMLHLHDQMKLDDEYQQHTTKHRIEFPAYSTWIVYTDQVSHAALSGQFLLEQTFYLPVDAMHTPETSPLKRLEKHFSREPSLIV